ncbi:E3 ubiquitin ligase [Takifugu flavidus]|uniref:E3 ubiquitin-protein ligase n=1 Tax=Takifugu flavidus TaxID=433684 RepID=A0A5C6PRG7_9TELE|nr:E3 ubiquitin ligase [Takifugu flavidus]
MGSLTSRQNIGVEEVDIPSSSVYRYPPKSGQSKSQADVLVGQWEVWKVVNLIRSCSWELLTKLQPPSCWSYFASHFIMGGEKFDSTHPEGYLFGENTDLNFLGTRPVAFPYAAPPPQEPVKTLRSLINIRKDTLRLVRCSEDLKLPGEEAAGKNRACYNIEFTFDADTQVAVTIYYQAIEEFHNGVPVYLPQDSSLQSETVHFKRGVSQQFCLPSHTVNLSEWAEDELLFDMDKEIFPMVIQAVVAEGEEHLGHSHILLATFEKHMDGSYCVKPLKQKQVVDGVSYLLQEIYGIENKYNSQESKVADDEISDNSAECVVCLSDVRDTLILPCRHLCLCNACADTLRYQANCCPICRLPFRALLQIRAMRKKLSPISPSSFNPVITSQTSDSEEHSASEHIPPGYEAVSLLEALNGPLNTSSVAPPALHSGPSHVSGALPPYSSEPHPAPARSLSPLDHSNSSQGLKLKKSGSKSLSQNSSVLPEEEDEKSCSESEAFQQKLSVDKQESGVTPDSENLTLSSSGAIDQSSCTGTPLSSTITSPEDPVSSSLVQSVMSMASSHSQHSHISTDTMSSMSGSYLAGVEGEPGADDGGDVEAEEENQDAFMESRGPSQQDGEFSQEPKGNNYSLAVEERDSEGNDVTEDDCSSPSNGKGGRSRCPELVNNNQGVALCDTPSMGLDNEQAPDSRFAGLMYLGGFRSALEPRPNRTSSSNINLEEPRLGTRDGQSPQDSRRGPFIV